MPNGSIWLRYLCVLIASQAWTPLNGVIYDESVALKSQEEIEKAVRNMGYMGATVHLDKKTRKNKLKLAYRIHAGHPYKVRHVVYDIDDLVISDYMRQDSAQSLLAPGMLFDVNVLDAERQRITKLLQNKGYYKFNKDFLVYQADTARNTYLVDLTLRLLPYQRRKEDLPQKHRQYKVGEVNFLADDEIRERLFSVRKCWLISIVSVRENCIVNRMCKTPIPIWGVCVP